MTSAGWLTFLRAPAVAALVAEQDSRQLSLFDQADLADIAYPDYYPGERLIACRTPPWPPSGARKRADLLTATETCSPRSPPP